MSATTYTKQNRPICLPPFNYQTNLRTQRYIHSYGSKSVIFRTLMLSRPLSYIVMKIILMITTTSKSTT